MVLQVFFQFRQKVVDIICNNVHVVDSCRGKSTCMPEAKLSQHCLALWQEDHCHWLHASVAFIIGADHCHFVSLDYRGYETQLFWCAKIENGSGDSSVADTSNVSFRLYDIPRYLKVDYMPTRIQIIKCPKARAILFVSFAAISRVIAASNVLYIGFIPKVSCTIFQSLWPVPIVAMAS